MAGAIIKLIHQGKLKAATLNLVRSAAVQEYVRSKDGTRIGYSRFGEGPAVVFVHGSLSKGSDWLGVAASLQQPLTCYQMDRRGHGRSEHGATAYSIEREYEDVVAVLTAAGSGASLVGHSFGAICALGAALRGAARRLILYEPPLPIGGLIAGENLAPYCRALADGRLEDALEIGLKKFVRVPGAAVHAMRASSGWSKLASLVPTWPRELKAMDELASDAEEYAAIACPTLLLLGTESPEHPFRHAISALSQTLPNVRTAYLKGQSHMAMRSAQGLLAELISGFVLA
jgi:pimeloyl-ACP methyl ester carboxylesterase